jgi:hypothetical protein
METLRNDKAQSCEHRYTAVCHFSFAVSLEVAEAYGVSEIERIEALIKWGSPTRKTPREFIF